MSYISPTPVTADPADGRLATPVEPDPYWQTAANTAKHPALRRLFRVLAFATPAERADAIPHLIDLCNQRLGANTVNATLDRRTDA